MVKFCPSRFAEDIGEIFQKVQRTYRSTFCLACNPTVFILFFVLSVLWYLTSQLNMFQCPAVCLTVITSSKTLIYDNYTKRLRFETEGNVLESLRTAENFVSYMIGP